MISNLAYEEMRDFQGYIFQVLEFSRKKIQELLGSVGTLQIACSLWANASTQINSRFRCSNFNKQKSKKTLEIWDKA